MDRSMNPMQATGSVDAPITVRSLALELGVSKSAVSAALSGNGTLNAATREHIRRAARERGFEPNTHARRLSNGHNNNNICLFALWLDFGVNTHKLQTIQGRLVAAGYDTPIYGLGLGNHFVAERQVELMANIRRLKSRAVVCVTRGLKPEALVELAKYQSEGGTLVCYDSPVALDCDRVLFDSDDNTYQSTRHLLELGHRKVAFAHHGLLKHESLRLSGYHRALAEFDVEPRGEWLLEGGEPSDYAAGGSEIARRLLQLEDRPTAISIVNDYAAMALIAELQHNGVRCPGDISVIGHDDHPMSAHFVVPLTTVSHPAEAIGVRVVELLEDRLRGSYAGPSRVETLKGRLVTRQSTAAPSLA